MSRTRHRPSKEFREASQAFYCSWARHYTFKDKRVNENFDHGTMCVECQLAVSHNILEVIKMPDMSAALHEFEIQRLTAKQERDTTVRRTRANADNNATGFVYYIRINEQIKIGYAKDVTARMRHYPPGSELLAVEAGTLEEAVLSRVEWGVRVGTWPVPEAYQDRKTAEYRAAHPFTGYEEYPHVVVTRTVISGDWVEAATEYRKAGE